MNTEEMESDGRAPLLTAMIGDHAPHEAADAEAIEDNNADESHLARMVQEFGGDIPRDVCADVLSWLAQEGLLAGSEKRAAADDNQWRSLCSKLLRTLQRIKDQQGGPVSVYAALAAWDVPEFDDINGHLSQQDFANTIIVRHEITRTNDGREKRVPIYLTKAAVNNALMDAQKHFGCGSRADQRPPEARENMKARRVEQLQK
jgi:hypothetical protein